MEGMPDGEAGQMEKRSEQIIIGTSDFSKLRRSGGYYVDKTRFIRSIMNDTGETSLYTRPRRFGKTLMMSAIRAFLEMDYSNPGDETAARELFSGLAILEDEAFCREHLAKWPVIHLSLKDAEGESFTESAENLRHILCECAKRHRLLAFSEKVLPEDREDIRCLLDLDKTPLEEALPLMRRSVALLEKALHVHFGRRVIVLIDKYDVPFNKARVNGHYKSTQQLLRMILSQALKDNPDLEKAIVTGCLRLARESVFTGLDQFVCNGVSSVENAAAFGFTSEEARGVLEDFGLESLEEEARAHYDGYRFGGLEIFCPWDLMNFCAKTAVNGGRPVFDNFWINTSGNEIVNEFIEESDEPRLALLKPMLAGGAVEAAVKDDLSFDELEKTHSSDMLLSLLWTTGYLTKIGDAPDGKTVLRIPNREVRECFERRIETCFSAANPRYVESSRALADAFISGRINDCIKAVSRVLRRSVSVRDAGAESFYHGLMLGMLSAASVARDENGRIVIADLASNREAGDGYSDIAFCDTDRTVGVVIELKRTESMNARDLMNRCREAMRQIEARKYWEIFEGTGIGTVRMYGIAFSGKDCRMMLETRSL